MVGGASLRAEFSNLQPTWPPCALWPICLQPWQPAWPSRNAEVAAAAAAAVAAPAAVTAAAARAHRCGSRVVGRMHAASRNASTRANAACLCSRCELSGALAHGCKEDQCHTPNHCPFFLHASLSLLTLHPIPSNLARPGTHLQYSETPILCSCPSRFSRCPETLRLFLLAESCCSPGLATMRESWKQSHLHTSCLDPSFLDLPSDCTGGPPRRLYPPASFAAALASRGTSAGACKAFPLLRACF